MTESDILETRKGQLLSLLPDWKGAEHSGIFAENFFMDNRLGDLVDLQDAGLGDARVDHPLQGSVAEDQVGDSGSADAAYRTQTG